MAAKIIPSKYAFFSAFLLALSSPLWSQGYLVFIAFIPFLWGMKNWNLKTTLVQSLWFQLFFSFLIFFWVPGSFHKLWNDGNWMIHTFFFISLMAIVELQIVVWAGIRFLVKDTNWILRVVISSGIYVVTDMYALKFVKDTLAHALFDHYSIKQWVAVTGVYSLTFFIMLINELFFQSLSNKNYKKTILPATLLIFAYGGGEVILREQNRQLKDEWTIALVQPNIGHNREITDIFNHNIAKKLLKLSDQALQSNAKIKYVIWPETTYPVDYFNPNSLADLQMNQTIDKWVIDNNVHLFFGSLIKIDGLLANAYIHLYAENGKIVSDYVLKKQPFPFGEEIPFQQTMPWLREIFPIPTISKKGVEVNNQIINQVKVGTLICFESIKNEISMQLKQLGSEIILNPTNESSFTSFGEPQLALALTSFRAIENQVPVIRVADTGLSAYIDSKGIIQYQSKMDTEEIKIISVPIFSKD